MKKIVASIFAASLLLLGTQAYAQWIPGAGYLHVIENTKNTSDGKTVGDPFHTNGFYVGVSYNFKLGQYFGIAPGFYLDVLMHGQNNASGISIYGIPVSATSNYHYTEVALNVPVNFSFKYEFSDNGAFFVFAGPTFQYGVMARSTFSSNVSIPYIHVNDKGAYNHYDAKDGDTNPFNILLGGGVGVQMGDIQFLVGYDHTLLNCSKVQNIHIGAHQIKAGINFEF